MSETTKTEKYAFFYKRLLHSTHIVRQDTGEEIAIPPETETLYSYMRDQYESYKALEKPFFESQESMGLKFKGRDRRWIAARIDVLNRLGLVKSEEQERDSYGHKRFHHTVIPLEEVSDNLLFYGPASISGGILAEGMLIRELEKKKPRGKPKTKKAAEPTNEEKKGDESDQGNAGKRDGVSDVHSNQHDDVSVHHEVSSNREIASLSDLLYWQNDGSDGLDEYLTMWGKPLREAQALIKSHITILHSQGNKGSRSAANDEPSGDGNHYKQHQAQRAAVAKQGANTQHSQDWDDTIPF